MAGSLQFALDETVIAPIRPAPEQLRAALSRWDNEGGAGPAGRSAARGAADTARLPRPDRNPVAETPGG